MKLGYDRHSQHTDWAVASSVVWTLGWCVMLQLTMIYIFSLLSFLDLCMPPVQVHVVVHRVRA